MNLLLPIAGKSTRFSGMRPKWLLTNPSGNLMIVDSILGINLSIFDNIYITYVKEHELKYQFKEGLLDNFNAYFLSNKIKFIELEDFTKDQVETVERTLAKIENAPFLIKDSDNQFLIDIKGESNEVAFVDLNQTEVNNVAAKSYLECDKYFNIINIIEKQVISNKICCGAYFFKNPDDFLKFSQINSNNRYISDVIFNAILNGENFKAIEAYSYVDWGTKEEWEKYKSKFKTLFIDIDGTLFENSSEYINPKIGTTAPIMKNIEFLRKKIDLDYTKLILTTSRPEKFREITVMQMEMVGLRFNSLIMGLPHGKRIIINDFSNTNKFPTCEAVNIPRNCDNLEDYISL